MQFGIYRIPHSICCLSFVSAYLYLTNSVAVQLTWRAHAYCMSQNWSFRLRRIVYTLHVQHQTHSPMGLMLFCADRFQTNIDGILNGSFNYNVHSYYNCSIADTQLRASSFLFELVIIRDSRQSCFGNVAFTKAELANITNHICSI